MAALFLHFLEGRAEARPPVARFRGGPRFVAAARTGCSRHVPEVPCGDGPDEAGPSRDMAALFLHFLEGRAEARPPVARFRGGPRFVAAARTGCSRHVPEVPCGHGPDEAGPSRDMAALFLYFLEGRAEARPPVARSRGGPRFVAAARTGCSRNVPEVLCGHGPDEAGPSRDAASLFLYFLEGRAEARPSVAPSTGRDALLRVLAGVGERIPHDGQSRSMGAAATERGLPVPCAGSRGRRDCFMG